MKTKLVLTITSVLYGIFGSAWLIMPDAMAQYWRIEAGTDPHSFGVNYMGHRYGAFMLGLVVAMWLARAAPHSQARRAVLIGALVTTALTTALSVHGALSLGLNAWPAVFTETAMGLALMWVLFVQQEPIVEGAQRSPAQELLG